MTLAPSPLGLENGDHLSRAEFERRYAAMPEVKKAELIEGVVYMGSPVRFDQHGAPHALIMLWLGTYAATTPGVQVGDHATVRLDAENEPQPDALLRWAQGTSRIDQHGYVVGPPELIVEIAASSVSLDMNTKRRVYRRNGVQEYLVWLVAEQTVHWWQLVESEYIALEPDSAGELHSRVFPGLGLDRVALLAGDGAKVLRALGQSLNPSNGQKD